MRKVNIRMRIASCKVPLSSIFRHPSRHSWASHVPDRAIDATGTMACKLGEVGSDAPDYPWILGSVVTEKLSASVLFPNSIVRLAWP